MRRSRLFAPALAPLLAATLLFGACNSDDESTKSSDDSSATTSESPSDSASESSEATDTAEPTDEASSTGNTVTAEESGVKFDLPKGWQSIDPAQVKANGEAPDLVKKMGITMEQFEQQLAALDVWAQNAEGENLNALVAPLPTLPTSDQLTQQFGALGFTVTSAEPVTTPIGEGIRTAYDLGASATTNTAGAGVFVDVDGKIVNISVTATTPESAAAVLDLVISTLTTA